MTITELRDQIKSALTTARRYLKSRTPLTPELKAMILAGLHPLMRLAGEVKAFMDRFLIRDNDLISWQNDEVVCKHKTMLLAGI